MTSMWIAILLAFLGTAGWRVLGVVVGDRLPQDGFLSSWVNTVAYAMVSGVMMLIVVFPSGLVATSSLEARLTALFLALAAMVWKRNLLLSVLAALSGFLAVTHFLPVV